MKMEIVKQFTKSKYNDELLNEDGIFISDDIVAVIDGVTSKTEGAAPGRDAMLLAKDLLKCVDPSEDAFSILSFLSDGFRKAFNKELLEKPACCVLIYNNVRQEIINYGDCNFIVDDEKYYNVKAIDKKLANKRASVLKEMLKQGYTVAELQETDPGREAIIEQLREAPRKYANQVSTFGYPILNGDDIIPTMIQKVSTKGKKEITLLSDGYPFLSSDFYEAESLLRSVLEKDPLCIDLYPSSKGVKRSNISFDDRTFVKIKVS